MSTTKITNTSVGTRGIYAADGSYVELAPGESRDVELSAADLKLAKTMTYFGFGADAAADEPEAPTSTALPTTRPKLIALAGDEGVAIETDDNVADLKRKITEARAAKEAGGGIPPVVQPTDELDKMSDADLADTVSALTGKAVGELPTDRDELLKLARGE